jgi:hypothetical protein
VQVFVFALTLALALSPGVRAMVRQSRSISFYGIAAVLMWILTLGPRMTFMGIEGFWGPYYLLMSLPGVNSLRVPARFWLMTTICLSVVAGLVVAELTRGRSRRMAAIAVAVLGLGVLGDGWIDRIRTAALPPPVPGASTLAGKIVFAVPPDFIFRDLQSAFRAVEGGWRSVNGYSGWAPSYYNPLVGAGRAEADDMFAPFQQHADLHVIVEQDAQRLRAVVERQPGATQIAADSSLIVYRLPRREVRPMPRPDGQRLTPRELRSECGTTLLPEAIDGDESTLWQCALWDERGWLLVDLGEVRTVGSVVNNLGSFSYLYPGGLHVETSIDGSAWGTAWSGSVREASILAGMADPRAMRLVAAFSSRQARFIRMRAEQGAPEVPWAIAELEVWSSSAESR